ncbi:MAG: glycosyltransferase family 2 protein [Phycisphaerae bacterium]
MSDPAVSVILPTYKRVQLLKRAIDSVCAQTFDDWELIVIDDGPSHDGTDRLVAGYGRRHGGRIVFIEQPNQGCNAARNAGIEAARGRYLAFLDADDEFKPAKLQRQLELFRLRPDLGLVFCDFSFVDLQGRFHDSVFDVDAPLARQVPYQEVAPGLRVCAPSLFEYLIRQYFIATIVGLVRRDMLADDIRFYVDNLYGRTEWMFYLDLSRRCRVGYVDEPLAVNHFVKGSISRTSRIRNSIDHRSLLRTMRSRYDDCSAEARHAIREQLAYTCRQLGMHSYKLFEYGAAARYFGEALCVEFDGTTVVYMMQSIARWISRFGRPGHEPRLRVSTQQ